MTVRLRIRPIAEERGYNLSAFQRRLDLHLGMARRLWYSTADGKASGPPLEYVSLQVLERIARHFHVSIGELFIDNDDGAPV